MGVILFMIMVIIMIESGFITKGLLVFGAALVVLLAAVFWTAPKGKGDEDKC